MTRAILRLVIVGVVCSLLMACGGQGELTGDVFIVTKGGQNIKLGLVTVTAIPADVLEKHIAERKREADIELAGLQPKIKSQRALYEAASAEYDRSPEGKALSGKEAFGKLYEKRRQAVSLLLDLEARGKHLQSNDIYFEQLPEAIATGKTDGDGRFTLTVPRRKKFGLAAKASREVGGNTEHYHWLLWTSLDGETSKKVLLSNDNMAGQGSPQSAVK